jgi:hypothetical protein
VAVLREKQGSTQFLKEMGGLHRRNPDLVYDYDGFYHNAQIQFLVNSSAFHCWPLLATHISAYDRATFVDDKAEGQIGRCVLAAGANKHRQGFFVPAN